MGRGAYAVGISAQVGSARADAMAVPIRAVVLRVHTIREAADADALCRIIAVGDQDARSFDVRRSGVAFIAHRVDQVVRRVAQADGVRAAVLDEVEVRAGYQVDVWYCGVVADHIVAACCEGRIRKRHRGVDYGTAPTTVHQLHGETVQADGVRSCVLQLNEFQAVVGAQIVVVHFVQPQRCEVIIVDRQGVRGRIAGNDRSGDEAQLQDHRLGGFHKEVLRGSQRYVLRIRIDRCGQEGDVGRSEGREVGATGSRAAQVGHLHDRIRSGRLRHGNADGSHATLCDGTRRRRESSKGQIIIHHGEREGGRCPNGGRSLTAGKVDEVENEHRVAINHTIVGHRKRHHLVRAAVRGEGHGLAGEAVDPRGTAALKVHIHGGRN